MNMSMIQKFKQILLQNHFFLTEINEWSFSNPYICINEMKYTFYHIMACCLFGAKQLAKPTLSFCQLNPQEQKYIFFHKNANKCKTVNVQSAKCWPFIFRLIYAKTKWKNSTVIFSNATGICFNELMILYVINSYMKIYPNDPNWMYVDKNDKHILKLNITQGILQIMSIFTFTFHNSEQNSLERSDAIWNR